MGYILCAYLYIFIFDYIWIFSQKCKLKFIKIKNEVLSSIITYLE